MAGAKASARYCPWQDLAARPHLAFMVARLPVADGWYLPDVPGIVVDDRLTRIERRCVLAHELAHVDLGHHQLAGNGPGSDRLARRNEAEADQLAARRLLPVASLVEWMPFASCAAEAAELLDVTEALLDVRLRGLSRRDTRRLGHLLDSVAAA